MADLFGGDEIDFDRAASAFPDISLDGDGDIPFSGAPSTQPVAPSNNTGFSFDAFDALPPVPKTTTVKVTGDDEIEKFESEFPEIDVGVSSGDYPLSFFFLSRPVNIMVTLL